MPSLSNEAYGCCIKFINYWGYGAEVNIEKQVQELVNNTIAQKVPIVEIIINETQKIKYETAILKAGFTLDVSFRNTYTNYGKNGNRIFIYRRFFFEEAELLNIKFEERPSPKEVSVAPPTVAEPSSTPPVAAAPPVFSETALVPETPRTIVYKYNAKKDDQLLEKLADMPTVTGKIVAGKLAKRVPVPKPRKSKEQKLPQPQFAQYDFRSISI